jgi:hypothetical protein
MTFTEKSWIASILNRNISLDKSIHVAKEGLA